jgi:hypothetical protein
VTSGVFAPGHLGELTQIVPFEMVDDVLAGTGAGKVRVRDLPVRAGVWKKLTGSLDGWRWPARRRRRCGTCVGGYRSPR